MASNCTRGGSGCEEAFLLIKSSGAEAQLPTDCWGHHSRVFRAVGCGTEGCGQGGDGLGLEILEVFSNCNDSVKSLRDGDPGVGLGWKVLFLLKQMVGVTLYLLETMFKHTRCIL